ncbi:unnamed protein product, partial [Heterosigma akashiwo]
RAGGGLGRAGAGGACLCDRDARRLHLQPLQRPLVRDGQRGGTVRDHGRLRAAPALPPGLRAPPVLLHGPAQLPADRRAGRRDGAAANPSGPKGGPGSTRGGGPRGDRPGSARRMRAPVRHAVPLGPVTTALY